MIPSRTMKRQTSTEPTPDRSEEASARFRVRVNMKHYFSDERGLALVTVRGARRVRWLHRRLRALFALPSRFSLLSDGHLLPPDEFLAVLRPDDLVDVVPSRIDLEAYRVEGNALDSARRTVILAPELGSSDSNRSNAVDDRISSATDRDSNEIHTGVDQTLNSFAVAREHNDSEELNERKRRALLLLEQYCGTDECSEARDPRPRRRRVRRRRREPAPAPPPAPPPDPSLIHAEPQPPPHPPPHPATYLGPRTTSGPEVGVLRNGIQMSRTPRLIRPLADTESFTYTA